MSELIYPRIILTGTLTTLADLHIGTGDQETIKNTEDKTKDTKEDTSFNTLCKDANKNPYIPASSLRGYLRAIIKTHCTSANNQDIVNDLFGLARQATNDDNEDEAETSVENTGNMGLIRIYDAKWLNNESYHEKDHLITRTRIDPLTKTAQTFQLFSHAVVPTGSTFSLEIELDNVTAEQLALVKNALETLSESYGGKLGKSKANGQGQIEWKQDNISVLTEEKFKEWLVASTNNKLSDQYQDAQELAELKPLIEKTAVFENKQTKSIKIQMCSTSPLLINDSERCQKVSKKRKEKNDDIKKQKNKDEKNNITNNEKFEFEPDLLFSQQQVDGKDYAIIPGASLKGWVRAHCRKIIYTLIKNKNTDSKASPDDLLEQIFGNTQHQGLIEFNTAHVEFSNDEIHQQTFTAIDRFTGGVLDGALYNAEAIWPTKALEGTIRYQTAKLKGWMRLLLLFVIRDAMQGDLVLGWGKSKGYGRLQLSYNDDSDWQTLYEKLDKEQLKHWQAKLDKKIKEACQIEKEDTETNTEEQGELA